MYKSPYASDAELASMSLSERATQKAKELAYEASTVSANIEQAKQVAINEPVITERNFRLAVTDAVKAKDWESFLEDQKTKSPLPEKALRDIFIKTLEVKSQFAKDEEAGKGKMFSDSELNASMTAQAVNAVVGGVGRAFDLLGSAVNVGTSIREHAIKAGISDDEWKTYEEYRRKRDLAADAQFALPNEKDPLKKEILRQRVKDASPENRTDTEKALFDGSNNIGGESTYKRIHDIHQIERTKSGITDTLGLVSEVVNKSDVELLTARAKADWNESTSALELLDRSLDTAVSNPAAIGQLVVQTIPDVLAMVAAPGVAIAANIEEKRKEAQDIYKQTHDGKTARGTDEDVLDATAIPAGVVDALGDSLIGHGGFNVAGAAAKAGLSSGSKIVDTVAKVATKATQKTVTGAAGEYVAEGGGQLLTQAAGKQDLSKLDFAEAHSEGLLGAAAGGVISTVTGTAEDASQITKTVVEKAQVRKQAVEEASIKQLLSPENKFDVVGAAAVLQKIITDKDISADKKAEALKDMDAVIDQKPVMEILLNRLKVQQQTEGFDEARAARIENGERKLKEIDQTIEKVNFIKDSVRGMSVGDAYKKLTEESDDETDTGVSRQAAKVIDEELSNPHASISAQMANEVLAKRADILTEDQRANLQSYIKAKSAMEELTEKLDTAAVNKNIVTGGGEDVGAFTYVSGIISSIKYKNLEQAKSILNDLTAFRDRHAHKASEYGKIVASFDAGTPMSADEQLAIMQPFESEKKGNKAQALEPRLGTHGKYLVPRFMRLMADEAEMLNTVTSVMAERVNRFENKFKASTEPVADVPAGSAPRRGAQAQPEITLDQLLDMEEEDAIKFLNPSNKEGTEERNDNNEFLSDDMSEAYSLDVADAEVIKTINEDTKPVRLVMPEEQVIHAVNDEGKVIGSISLQDGETAVQMHEASSKQGIGSQLIVEFIRRYPNAKAGSFTSDGLKAYKKALDILKKEREANRAQDTVVAEQPTVSQPVKPETVQTTEQPAVPEVATLERETEVETGTVSDEVLNEGVATELPAVDAETKSVFDTQVEDLISDVDSVTEELKSLIKPRKKFFSNEKIDKDNSAVKAAIVSLNTRGTVSKDVLEALSFIASAPLIEAIKAISADATKLRVADNIREILQQSREKELKANTTAISQMEPSTLPSFLQNLKTGDSVIGKTGNAVLDYFGFRSDKGISNPLVSMKGFMNRLAEGVTFEEIQHLLPAKYKELTAGNKTVLKHVADFNKQFHETFLATYIPTEFKHAHKDFAAYFVDEAGTFKPEVIDAMSVAAFNWFVTKSNDSLDTDEDKIGGILGLNDTKGKYFSNYTWDVVSNLGVPYTQETQALGDSIQKSLGLYALTNAPWTVDGRLSDALGNAAMQTMLNLKDEAGVHYLKEVTLTGQQREIMHLVDVAGSHEVAAAIAKTKNDIETKNTKVWLTGNKSLRTLQVNYTETDNGFRSPIGTIQGKILGPAKLQGSFLQDLFGALTTDKLPTFEPVDVRKQSQVMKRTDRKLSRFSKNVHQKFNNVKALLKPEMVNVLGRFNNEALATMFGAIPNVELVRHVDNVKSQMSKNNLIKRSVDSLMDFIMNFEDLSGNTGYDTPFYLNHETNRVGRDQLVQRVMNMQSDKIARHAAYRDGWQVTIAMNDSEMLENFQRAVGQAMGVSLDKKNNEKSTKDSVEKINDPVIAKAIQAAVGILNNEDDVDTQAIYDAVMHIGTAAAGLDGIMTYAKYEQAKQAGASEFEVNIGVERDGVTNGPIFTLLQFGDVGEGWANLLSSGGWFIDSPYENVADAKEDGIKDLYEKVAEIVNAMFKSKTVFQISKNESVDITPEMRQAFINLFGSKNKLTDEIEIATRNAAKPMLTVKNYQSSDYAARVKAGITTIELLKEAIERTVEFDDVDPVQHAANLSEVGKILRAINAIAPGYISFNRQDPLKTVVSTTKLIDVPVFNAKLNKHYIKQMTVPEFISITYGNMFVEAVNAQNSLISQMTNDAVKVSNMAVMAYDAVRTKLIKEAQAEKLKNAPTKVALFNELTKAEMRAIENQLADAFPEVYTALSKQQGEGTSIVEYETDPEIKSYKVETTVNGTDGNKHYSTIEGEGNRVSAPGVTGVVNKVLALDGATLTKSKDKFPSMLGLFDATMNGLTSDLEAAKQLNRDMFDVTMNHSIPLEVASMSERVLTKAIELMGEDFKFDVDTLKRFKLDGMSIDLRVAMNHTTFLKNAAAKQLEKRQQYLKSHEVTVNHYYAEGAAVTFVNGEEVVAKDKSAEELTNDFVKAAKQIVKEPVIKKQQPKAETGNKPKLDLPSKTSESLIAAFGKKNVISVSAALRSFPDRLADNRLPTINAVKAIVNQLVKSLDAEVKIVKYSDDETYTGDLAWMNTNEDLIKHAEYSHGMYFPATSDRPATIVLMDEFMPNSGMNSETLFHELIHALFDKKVFKNNTHPAFIELQRMMATVKKELPALMKMDAEINAFVNSNQVDGVFSPLENEKEFLAYGLSSVGFQNILSKINYTTPQELSNKFTVNPKTLLTKLRNLVQKVLFNRPMGADVNVPIDNALKSLIDVALSLHESTLSEESKPSRQAASMKQLINVTKLNSKEVFNRLASIGGTPISSKHQEHLSNMMDTVVNTVLQPLKVNLITASVSEHDSDLSAKDKLDVLLSSNTGIKLPNPPAQYGFNKSAQEAYVYGMYLNILEHGLQVGNPYINAANQLFNEARDKMTYLDFMEDPTNVDPTAVALAKARYNSVFTVKTDKVITVLDESSGMTSTKQSSNYLRNFLALAATNELFRNKLDSIVIGNSNQPQTLFNKIIKLVIGIVDWVGNRITGVDTNKSIMTNLDLLTKRLVSNEYRAQSKVEAALAETLDSTSSTADKAVGIFKNGLTTVTNNPLFGKDSPYAITRLAGRTLRMVGNNQMPFVYDAFGEYMERLSAGKQGLIGELGTEIKGTTKNNTKIHTLMRIANHVLDRGRKGIIDNMAKVLESTFSYKLSKEEKSAITKALLRTDVDPLLNQYSLTNIADMLEGSKALENEIDRLEQAIAGAVPNADANFYVNKTQQLGMVMIRGSSNQRLTIPNAHGIARLWGTTHNAPNELVLSYVEPLIDQLASLRAIEALRKLNPTHANIAAQVIRKEMNHNPDHNGITFLMSQHRLLKERALRDNFNGKPGLMRKGYMPDITNPYIHAIPAPIADRAEMLRKGYKEMYTLDNDVGSPKQEQLALFVGDGAGLATYMRGAMGTTGKRAKGTKLDDFGDVMLMQAVTANEVEAAFQGRIKPVWDGGLVAMQEVFTEDGKLDNYRYIMSEAAKDSVLERNDDFTEVMGSLAGKIYDKTVTTPHNELVIKSLKEQYDIDMQANKYYNYITVSASSTDPELRDMYRMLPQETKKAIRDAFGKDELPIRAEALRIIFGYRKMTIAQLWDDEESMSVLKEIARNMIDMLAFGQGMHRASQVERVMMDLVRVAKTNIVVRTGSVLLANMVSNTYTLVVSGLNPVTAAVDQAVGIKKGIEYVKQASRIAEIDLLLEANHQPAHRAKLESEKAQLKHLQSINPVGELIEAGLLQTIVLDVRQDIDPFSSSSKLAAKINDQLDKLPESAADTLKFVFMTRDSASFDFMNKMTQFSDFGARYALFKHLTTRKNNPIDKSTATQAVINKFVNYDLPTHRAIQYGNDIGLIWFSKYFIRIQKTIAETFAENPGRVLMGLALQGMVGFDIPDMADSSFVHTGVFHPIRGFDNIFSGIVANLVVPEL